MRSGRSKIGSELIGVGLSKGYWKRGLIALGLRSQKLKPESLDSKGGMSVLIDRPARGEERGVLGISSTMLEKVRRLTSLRLELPKILELARSLSTDDGGEGEVAGGYERTLELRGT